jgi:AraC family transcriptional regulator
VPGDQSTLPFTELPLTFGRHKGTAGRHLNETPWSVTHDYGMLFYCPAEFGQTHIRLNHHLFGIELDPGIVRTQINSGPVVDSVQRSRSFYFVPSGSTVEVRKEQPIEFMLVTLDPRFVELFPGDAGYAIGNIVDASLTAKALELRSGFLKGECVSKLASELVQIAVAAFYRSYREATEPQSYQLTLVRIRRALQFVSTHYAERITVEDIADAVGGTSVFHFAHVFESTLGQSPHQYLLEQRLRQARDLLMLTSNHIADIAYSVGFSSQAHMTESFSRRLGVTPAKMRRSIVFRSAEK